MNGRATAVMALVLATMTAMPARAQHLVTTEEAAAHVQQATVSTGIYMLAGAGVLLIILLIIGLAIGSGE